MGGMPSDATVGTDEALDETVRIFERRDFARHFFGRKFVEVGRCEHVERFMRAFFIEFNLEPIKSFLLRAIVPGRRSSRLRL